jgi:Predicted lipoprotein of unknown function (DUF2380)
MTDELLRPDWFLRPQNWPYWMPNTLLGTLPPLARLRDPGNEFDIHGLQQSSRANGEPPSLLGDVRSTPVPAWLDPVSSPANGGILQSLTRTGDLDQSLSGWAQSLAPLAARAGILAPLTSAKGPWGQGVPVWRPSGSQWVGEPDPARQHSWTVPPLSALGTAQRASDASDRQTSAARPTLDDILSDADAQELVSGARYAQMPPRRGAIPRGGREPTPAESIRLLLHANAHRTLRELDPKNPQLQSLSSPTWVPSRSDIARLHEEIARVRRERGLPELELHHTLPRQFAPQFNEAGIDIESYRTYLAKDQHRLLPKGLHTGTDNWNAQWKRFFEKNKHAKEKEIWKLLNAMLKELFR